jgi:hypothetical protein
MLPEFYSNGKGPNMDGQKGYLNFIDMINGGGMGAAGDKFEGGGLLSMLGNALGIAPYGAARERDLEMAANAAAGVAIKPDIMKPIIDAEKDAVGGVTQTKLPPAAQSPLQAFGGQQPPAYEPVSYDPRGPMYGDQNAVSDQELMQFAQSMHPDNRYFFLNSDRATQVQSYLQAMGY